MSTDGTTISTDSDQDILRICSKCDLFFSQVDGFTRINGEKFYAGYVPVE